MNENKKLLSTNKEVVTALIKQNNIHSGLWGLYVEFGLSAANVEKNPGDIYPAAIVPVVNIGIQLLETENNLSVNAEMVNPEP
jgi:hypothetical protein